MARPQAPDYAQRREAIMRVAAGLYATQGFHATPVSAITAASGISKSLLYHYFPSKEELLFEVMSSHVEALLAATNDAELADRAPAGNLLAFARVILAHSKGAQHYHKVLLDELDSLPPPLRKKIVAQQRQMLDAIDRQLVRLHPDLPKPKRRAATMLFLGMMNWTHTWFDPAGDVTSDELATLATNMLVRGMAR